MSKKKIYLVLALCVIGLLFTKNIFAMGARGGYSGTQRSMQEFTRRIQEINSNQEFKNLAGSDAILYIRNYAGSQNSMEVFLRRIREINNSQEFLNLAGSDAILHVGNCTPPCSGG